MNKSIRNRSILVIIIVLICFFGIIGFPSTFQKLESNLSDRIKLGLDLKGGTYMVLQVHVQDAVKNFSDQALVRLRDDLRSRNVTATVEKTDDTHIVIKGVTGNTATILQTLVQSEFPEWFLGDLAGDPNARVMTLKTSEIASTKNDAFTLAMATIGRRVNGLGIAETTITQYGGSGNYEMVVELPGFTDVDRARGLIQSTAMLELKMVRGGHYASRDEALASFGGVLPPDTQLLPGVTESGTPTYYLVDSIPILTGNDLRSAEPSQDSQGRPDISFTVTRSAASRLSRITGQNIGKNMAIVLDNQVQEAPVIDGQLGDSDQITGSFTPQQASDLALKLRSGALPASITPLSESVVGPSLGSDSIHHGVEACIIGFLAILIFMLVYYKGAGVNADVALLLNLLILIAAMVYFGGAFTLPGIAGVILTVGMGVDSNVLIFERIREELRAGKAPPAAVAGGFDHAFKTIIDTHVTTVASAAILFAFGTGPVRGFAVTLVIGLIANLFTSVFVSRVIFDYVLGRRARGEALSV
ncbi:MAG: protein translocase subunit SecD [Terriglobia bacterium]